MKRAAIIAGILALLAACAAQPEWAGSIQDRNGVTYVANPEIGLWADAEASPLSFELEQVFGSDGAPIEAMLGNPYQVNFDVDDQSNVYILDGQASRLVAFSPDGAVLWTAGRQGDGPGELNNPNGISVSPSGMIAVGNNRSTRLELWNTAGEFAGGLSLAQAPADLTGATFLQFAGFVDPNTLVVYSGIRGGFGSRVYLLAIEPLELRGEFEWNQLPELPMSPNLSADLPIRAAGDFILAGSSAGYRFRIYDAAGSLLREISRRVDYPVRPGFYEQDRRRGMSTFGSLSPPMPLPSGHLLVATSWTLGIDDPDAVALENMRSARERRPPPPRETASSLDLFDQEGRFLYSIVEEGLTLSIGAPQFVGPDGKLYTKTHDPFPQVRRYRVVIES